MQNEPLWSPRNNLPRLKAGGEFITPDGRFKVVNGSRSNNPMLSAIYEGQSDSEAPLSSQYVVYQSNGKGGWVNTGLNANDSVQAAQGLLDPRLYDTTLTGPTAEYMRKSYAANPLGSAGRVLGQMNHRGTVGGAGSGDSKAFSAQSFWPARFGSDPSNTKAAGMNPAQFAQNSAQWGSYMSPEAQSARDDKPGFLEKYGGALAGIGSMFIPGMQAWGAGMIAGAINGANQGGIDNVLKGGAIGGATGWAGGQITQGLSTNAGTWMEGISPETLASAGYSAAEIGALQQAATSGAVFGTNGLMSTGNQVADKALNSAATSAVKSGVSSAINGSDLGKTGLSAAVGGVSGLTGSVASDVVNSDGVQSALGNSASPFNPFAYSPDTADAIWSEDATIDPSTADAAWGAGAAPTGMADAIWSKDATIDPTLSDKMFGSTGTPVHDPSLIGNIVANRVPGLAANVAGNWTADALKPDVQALQRPAFTPQSQVFANPAGLQGYTDNAEYEHYKWSGPQYMSTLGRKTVIPGSGMLTSSFGQGNDNYGFNGKFGL